MGTKKETHELLPGTLDLNLLILRTLTSGAAHGYGIAERLKSVSEDVLEVGAAEWGASENNRRAATTR